MIGQLSVSRLTALVGALALSLCFFGLTTTTQQQQQRHARRSLLVVEEEEPLLLSNRIRKLKASKPTTNIESKDVTSKQYGRYDRPRRLESLEIAKGNSGKPEFVLFCCMLWCVQYEYSTIRILHLNLVCL